MGKGEGERGEADRLTELETRAGELATAFADMPEVAAAATALRAAAGEHLAALRAARAARGEGTPAGEAATRLRLALERLAAPGEGAWTGALRAALAGGEAVPGGTARAVRARAGDALRRFVAAGEPADDGLRLLLATGLLGAYLAMLDGPAAGEAAGRARALAPGGSEDVARAALAEGGPRDSDHWPVWAAIVRGGAASLPGKAAAGRAWAAFLACALANDEALRAACVDPTLLAFPPPWGDIGEAAARMSGRWRANALAIRLGSEETRREGRRASATCWYWEDGTTRALAAGLPARWQRRAALRALATGPETHPRALGTCRGALAGEQGGAGRAGEPGASAASRGRCARLLANLPTPAWAGALWLAGPGVPGARAIWRKVAASPGDETATSAAWLLAEHGEAGDEATIRAALERTDPYPLESKAGALSMLLGREDTPLRRAAAAGLLDAARRHESGPGAKILALLGRHAPLAGAGLAAALLASRNDAPFAARWLVTCAPEWATAGALCAGGLLPGGPGDAAGRRAARLLANAWAGALGTPGTRTG